MSEDRASNLLADYPVTAPVVVQWGDQDAFGHVNNTVFLRWFEVGRIAYFSEIRMPHDAQGAGDPAEISLTSHLRKLQHGGPGKVALGDMVAQIDGSAGPGPILLILTLPVMMPLAAVGSTILAIVFHFGTPSAYDASRSSFGTSFSISSVERTTTGIMSSTRASDP